MKLEQSFTQYKEGLEQIKAFFDIKSTIHEITWCEEIRLVAFAYGGIGYKYKGEQKWLDIGHLDDCIVFKQGDYTAILHKDYDEPTILYITARFLD